MKHRCQSKRVSEKRVVVFFMVLVVGRPPCRSPRPKRASSGHRGCVAVAPLPAIGPSRVVAERARGARAHGPRRRRDRRSRRGTGAPLPSVGQGTSSRGRRADAVDDADDEPSATGSRCPARPPPVRRSPLRPSEPGGGGAAEDREARRAHDDEQAVGHGRKVNPSCMRGRSSPLEGGSLPVVCTHRACLSGHERPPVAFILKQI